MKVVILAGGYGTRISEESHLKPKPMIEIGGMPILWHIMKHYSYYGFNEFIICMGYKANIIRDFFANYYLYTSDVTFDLSKENKWTIHKNVSEPWKVTLVDTGLGTGTGGRLKRIRKYIGNETFMLTYGDGVSDVNLKKLLAFHHKKKKIATITTVNVGQKFGVVATDKTGKISSFKEKPSGETGAINGGFMVLEPSIFKYIANDKTMLEQSPLIHLAKENQLVGYHHEGFWKCMDTLRDRQQLEQLIQNNSAPWIIWNKKNGK